MTTMSTPYHDTFADDDTLRMPLPTADHTPDRRSTGLVLNPTRLWTGGPRSQRSSAWSAPS
jgi:hypothetical protein